MNHLMTNGRLNVLEEVNMESDGNCMFRSVSDQMYHTPAHHGAVRAAVCDYIRA